MARPLGAPRAYRTTTMISTKMRGLNDTIIRELRKMQPKLEQPGDGLLDCYQHWQDHHDELLK
jgi:hypothetical protein